MRQPMEVRPVKEAVLLQRSGLTFRQDNQRGVLLAHLRLKISSGDMEIFPGIDSVADDRWSEGIPSGNCKWGTTKKNINRLERAIRNTKGLLSIESGWNL